MLVENIVFTVNPIYIMKLFLFQDQKGKSELSLIFIDHQNYLILLQVLPFLRFYKVDILMNYFDHEYACNICNWTYSNQQSVFYPQKRLNRTLSKLISVYQKN